MNYSEPSSEAQALALAFSAAGPAALARLGTSAGMEAPKPFAQPIMLAEGVNVAGTTHVPDIARHANALQPGDRLTLRRQPDNVHDRWSIAVLNAAGVKLGYVPCDINEIPARLMDGGKHLYAQVSEVERRGSWHRIGMEVYLDD